jgi:hypothetical protein
MNGRFRRNSLTVQPAFWLEPSRSAFRCVRIPAAEIQFKLGAERPCFGPTSCRFRENTFFGLSVTMPGDHQSHSHRTTPALQERVGALVFCAMMLLSGCVTPQVFIPIASDRSGSASQEVTTVRSQDSALQQAWLRAEDDSPTATSGPSRNGAVAQSNRSRIQPVSGHAFAQPKARLGRPVPMSNQKSSPAVVPSTGHSELSGPQHDSSQVPRPQGKMTSPWSTSGPAWQPAAGSQGNLNAADAMRREMELRNSGAMISAQTAAATSSGDISENSNGLNPAAIDNGASAAIDQPEVTTEPSMLDRLRGLYNPRIDDNTDKLRKQIRRWPDPFGLLKDREEPVAPDAENNLVPGSPDAGQQSADLSTPPQPIVVEATPENSHIQLAIQELEAELSGWNQKISGDKDRAAEWRQKQTDLRLLYMIAGKSAESVRIIESLPEEEQEFWQSLMMSMNSYRDHSEDVDRTEQLTESLRHLRTASKKLQPLSRLTIQRSMLCDRIDGFGNVVAFPTSNFEPGQRVLVYTELQNFQSELTEDGKYRSEFAARIEFMREGDDEVLEKIQVLQIEDLCDVERTDYFQSFELTLPALEGKYRMRIMLRDYLSQQVAESSLEFSVRSRSGGPLAAN